MHVLVIEDDREHAQFIEKVLCEAGHSVETAEDGAGGLSRAREDQFDALVVDGNASPASQLRRWDHDDNDRWFEKVVRLSTADDITHVWVDGSLVAGRATR